MTTNIASLSRRRPVVSLTTSLFVGSLIAWWVITSLNTPTRIYMQTSPYVRSSPNDLSGVNKSELSFLSYKLNSIERRLQQLACLTSASSTTDTGGWCNRAVAVEHRTDEGLARALAILLFGSRVISVGEGLGEYRRLVLETGFLDRYDAYDGSPFVEELTEGRVGFLDLAVPQFWLPVYDWTVCLEVLEHVPVIFESSAVENVVRPARVGVVLSWARPGQGGLEHVNSRSQDYVDEMMVERGFELDVAASTRLRDAATFAWFKFTLNVYRRTNESIDSFDYVRSLAANEKRFSQ